MTTLIDDYLRQVESSLRVDAARKRQIVDELRTHLTEKADEVHAADPERPRHDVEQEVLRDFGNPHDLALAYEPEGAVVLTNKAGEIVLRVGEAVGRGAAAVGRGSAKVLKWTAIAMAALLVVALGVGAWAYYEVKPHLPGIISQSEPVYQYWERCADTPCSGEPPADLFYVGADAKTVRLDLSVYSVHAARGSDQHLGSGTVNVTVIDPTGSTRYSRAHALANESSIHFESSWAAVEGNWSIAYAFDGFLGAIDVETYAVSFPWPE